MVQLIILQVKENCIYFLRWHVKSQDISKLIISIGHAFFFSGNLCVLGGEKTFYGVLCLMIEKQIV